MAKFDTGAGVTVISSDLFLDDKSGEALEKLEDYFKSRGCCGREFVSASGDTIIFYIPKIPPHIFHHLHRSTMRIFDSQW